MEVLWLALFYRRRSWSLKSLSLPKVPQLVSGRMGFEPSLTILLYCFVCQQNLPSHFGFWLLPGTLLAVSLWPTLPAPLPPAWGFPWSEFLNNKCWDMDHWGILLTQRFWVSKSGVYDPAFLTSFWVIPMLSVHGPSFDVHTQGDTWFCRTDSSSVSPSDSGEHCRAASKTGSLLDLPNVPIEMLSFAKPHSLSCCPVLPSSTAYSPFLCLSPTSLPSPFCVSFRWLLTALLNNLHYHFCYWSSHERNAASVSGYPEVL